MDDLAHAVNVCLPDGPVPLREEDARLLAMLDVGGNRLVVLWAGMPTDRQVLVMAAARARQQGYTILETRSATPEAVAACYDQGKRQTADDVESTEATRQFDALLTEAIELGASDLHLQMHRRHAAVKVRVHGELIELRQIPVATAESMARAMYRQADVDSRRNKADFDPRTYQDASISRTLKIGGRLEEYKLRWASGPVWPDAFDVSLRILHIAQQSAKRSLYSLGYDAAQVAALMDALRKPSGVIVLCGTTGSGKSTTLATLADVWLSRFGGRRLLRSIEDPPEYVIVGGRQMPVSRSDSSRDEEGFYGALRAAMRMDPDALLLGEVRDAATANLLQQCVETGHKVLTSTHAGSPFAALWRLEELGIARDRLTSEDFLNAIVHQVLVPVLCPHCAVPLRDAQNVAEHVRQIEAELPASVSLGARLRSEHGCAQCRNGIVGRQALAELLIPDTAVCALLRAGRDVEAKRYWRQGKCAWHGAVQARSIIDQALDLVAAGRLSPVDAELCIGPLKQMPEGES